MVLDQKTRNVFTIWLDEMDFTSEQAAELLGKSVRMVKYYEGGRELPVDTMYLMDALAEGYRPRRLVSRHQK